VRSDATGTRYGIGIRALLVGTSYLDSDPYLPLITPFLDDLRAELDETFHLGRLDGGDGFAYSGCCGLLTIQSRCKRDLHRNAPYDTALPAQDAAVY
jgi:DNA-binding IclR family transcriptional regulator